jgi:polysaccharide chain length determinant protein (PEP-CTERM system associated)
MEDLRSLLGRFTFSLWRKRWIALAVAWVLCIGGWFAVAAIPNEYEASARIYVDTDAVLGPLLRGLALDNTRGNQLELLERTVLSRPNLEKLVSKTDLELGISGPADLERTVAHLAQDIKLVPQTRDLFSFSYRSTSAKLAYDVVQTILTIFIESKTGSNRVDMENGRQFIEQQITQYEQKLRLAEAKRAEFRTKYMDLLPNDANGTSHLEAARTQLANLQEHLKDAQQHHDMLKQELDSTPETLGGDGDALGVAGGGNSPLVEAQRRLAELRTRYTDNAPEVKDAVRMVELLGRGGSDSSSSASGARTPASRVRGIPNPMHDQLKMQLFDTEGTIATLQRQIDDQTKERDKLEAIARGAPGLMAEFTDLNRDYDVLRKNHEELLARRESMRISAAADTDAEKVKLDVVDPPQVPQIPVAPKRVLLDSAVLALGLAGGVGFALMLLQFDSSFQTTDELRKLELPVAGSISLIATAVPLHRRMLSVTGFAMAVLLLCAVWGGLVVRMLRAGIA